MTTSGTSTASITVILTYQNKAFFMCGDVSLVHKGSYTASSAFGLDGTNASQFRRVLEAGFLF
ncbi:MAG: hypothetical protein ABI164_10205 [Acidobacteriaceae bacterium]